MENDDKYGSREEEWSQTEKSISSGQSERQRIAHSVRTRQGGEMIGPRPNQDRRFSFHDSMNYRRNMRSSLDDHVLWNEGDVEDDMEGIRPPARSRRTMSAVNDLTMERNYGTNVMQQGRFFKPMYSDEGSSYIGYGEQVRYPEGRDERSRLAHFESDRAGLIKKLDELKEQIRKSGEMAERPGGRISFGRRPPTSPDTYGHMSGGLPFPIENQALHSGHGHAPSLGGYGDAYHKQNSRRPLYQQPSYHRQYSEQRYVDRMPFNRDHLIPRPHETRFHHPACSCSRCLTNNYYGHEENHTNPTNFASYHHMNSTAMDTIGNSSDGSHLYNQLQFTRAESLIDSEYGSFQRQWPRKIIVSKGGTRVNHPMAGGAPFIACLHCSVLLNIPVRVLRGTNQGKVKCGACSSIVVLECGPKGIILSVPPENKNDLEGISYVSDEVPSDKFEHNSNIPSCGGQDHPDSVSMQSLEERRPISRESEKRRLNHISNSSLSEHNESPDNVIIREDVSHPAKPSLEHDVLPRHEDSPQKAHPAPLHSDDSTILNGNENNALVESERDISVDNCTYNGISQDSTDVVSKEGYKTRINKFTGLVNNSPKDLKKSGHEIENVKPNILINGHMISERLLKKAEKVAGPIEPGQYWYDYRAGFWGVMGHPCLGVIPAKIEEFKFAMPEDCSNGNTKVFVNGRELHQEDLDLLSSRGLSITRHKYYLIEISGKVVDEQTGRELASLGTLAPTVERLGHGFGMTIHKSKS